MSDAWLKDTQCYNTETLSLPIKKYGNKKYKKIILNKRSYRDAIILCDQCKLTIPIYGNVKLPFQTYIMPLHALLPLEPPHST